MEQTDNMLKVSTKSDSTAMSGTTRSLATQYGDRRIKRLGKETLLVGVGYRAKADKLKLELSCWLFSSCKF